MSIEPSEQNASQFLVEILRCIAPLWTCGARLVAEGVWLDYAPSPIDVSPISATPVLYRRM